MLYQFLTIWVLDAPIEQVWQAIIDYDTLPQWWSAVRELNQIESGTEDGVGSRWQQVWVTPLSYKIKFTAEILRVESPYLLEIAAKGNVNGQGMWQLQATPTGTEVRYYWTVKTTEAWMNRVAVILRPLLEWNHNAIMTQGGQGLAQHLGVALVKVENLKGAYPGELAELKKL
ncbi:MAG: SRPBCC family protein [Spirulinaceae cyanobacterium]